MNYKCPICGETLIHKERTYQCNNRHSFDLSSSNYLNLVISNKKAHGDDKTLIDARTRFLNAGYYANLQQKLIELAIKYQPKTILDLGCGQGYYTNAIANHCPEAEVIGTDISKQAIKTASKNSKANYIICSSFDLPLFDNSIDCCFNIFTPVAANEIERILTDNGILIVVSPGEKHLFELKEALYTTPYLNKKLEIKTSCTLIDTIYLNNTFELSCNQHILDLFSMTPYYYKTSQTDAAKLNQLDTLKCSSEFIIQIFKKEA